MKSIFLYAFFVAFNKKNKKNCSIINRETIKILVGGAYEKN